MDSARRADYLLGMKLALRLLCVLLLAAITVSAGGALPGAKAEVAHVTSVESVGMDMVECTACAPDQLSAGMNACGSICISATVAMPDVQILQRDPIVGCLPALGDLALTGRSCLPELAPPKQILS